MSHDTAKDPRILVAQRACALLRQSLQQKSHVKLAVGKEKLLEMASSVESAVMTVMYSYQEPDALASADATEQVVATSRSLADALAPVLSASAAAPLLKANFRWCLRTLIGFADRFHVPAGSLASGVDLRAVVVRNVAKTGSLWLTRVSDGETEYPVVTNIAGVSTGDVLAVAFLPPREVGGTISEAMFLGEERRGEPAGTILTEDEVDAREATSILHDELAKK
jgi:predicted RNA-binding protein with EMAP domain